MASNIKLYWFEREKKEKPKIKRKRKHRLPLD